MVPPLCSQGQHLWKHPCCPNIWVINHITNSRFPSSTQNIYISTHYISFIIHTSTRTCHIHTQEGSNRSLPSWTLLAVLWQMCHVWITYRTSSGAVLMLDKLSRKYQKSTTWHASGSLMTGIPCLEHP